ncbi:MAG: 2-amino-4-hydroxy-6-hydroxymethyldihydropteridine diphosphokinase [Kofleriaceae bacterium]
MKPLAETTLLLGLGGNVGTEVEIVERMRKVLVAVQSWGALADSAVYRTAAIGPPQPAFLNAALRISLAPPAWQPAELITAVLELESLLGRDRRGEERWGPRRMDLDVLLWGPRPQRFAGPPALEVPHPRLAERRFALEPLVDLLDEDTELPGTGRTLAHALRQVSTQEVELTDWKLR